MTPGCSVIVACIGGDFDLAPAVAEQHQHRVADGLAREAGAGGAEGDRRLQPRAACEHAADFALVLDDDDELRHQPVEAGVRAPGEQAQRIVDQARRPG